MRAGRNDPCPCGSGKKYKKCCWEKDREEESRKPLVPLPPAPVPVAARSQAEEELDGDWDMEDLDEDREGEPEAREEANPAAVARWEEFEKADPPRRWELFQRTLDEGLMDEENAAEMLSALRAELIERGERERFDELVEAVRQRAPASCEANAVSLVTDQISDALALNRLERLPELAVRLGQQGDTMTELRSLSLDQLMYHGHLDAALAVLRASWPKVRDSVELLEWAVEEDRQTGANLEVYAFLENNPRAEGDPALRERLRFFVDELDEQRVAERVALLTGRQAVSGDLADYQGSPGQKKSKKKYRSQFSEEGRRRLWELGIAFVGYLRAQGVPYSRAELARQGMVEYLLERAGGALRRGGAGAAHPLCPDHASLDEYLGGCLSLLSGRLYQAFAQFELLPAWMRFLVSLGLLTAEHHRQAHGALRRLRQPLEQLCRTQKDDPRLGEGLSAWDAEP